jgi:hypothetical protein
MMSTATVPITVYVSTIGNDSKDLYRISGDRPAVITR